MYADRYYRRKVNFRIVPANESKNFLLAQRVTEKVREPMSHPPLAQLRARTLRFADACDVCALIHELREMRGELPFPASRSLPPRTRRSFANPVPIRNNSR